MNYDPNAPSGAGAATLDSSGDPVIGFGTAPIDIPNCERCHSDGTGRHDNPERRTAGGTLTDCANIPNNVPSRARAGAADAEYKFWNAYYGIDRG